MYCEFGQAVGIKEKLIVTFYHGISNLKNWFDLRSEAVVLVISRYAFTVFVIFVYYIVIKKLVKREKLTEGFFMELSVALTLSAAWALQILFYDVFDWRDYRVLYQLAWFGVVVVILNEYKVVQKLYFATQFVTLALATFNMDAYFSPLEAESYSAIMSEVRYDVNADSRWDNTIYNDIGANQALCLLPEQGIGINYKWQRSLFEMAQVKQEVSYAEVTPAQAVRSGKVAVTVRIAGAEADIHSGADAVAVETGSALHSLMTISKRTFGIFGSTHQREKLSLLFGQLMVKS